MEEAAPILGELILSDEYKEIERKRKNIQKRPKSKKSQVSRVTESLNETYELIGGVPRMAIWANEPTNQSDFYKLWARTGQKTELMHSGKVIIRPALPKSALDD